MESETTFERFLFIEVSLYYIYVNKNKYGVLHVAYGSEIN